MTDERSADEEGPKDPSRKTPDRVPGSVRRTHTLDGNHPEGLDGPTHLDLRGRDLLTRLDGSTCVLGEVRVRLVVERGAGVIAISADPNDDRLQQLIGVRPRSGWRQTVATLLPDHRHRRSLHYLLLDAASAWAGLSRFAEIAPSGPPDASVWQSSLGVCAGWRPHGSIDQRLQAGQPITRFRRPEAPSLDVPDDPLAWHDAPPVGPGTMRRRRRLDVVRGHDELHVEGMFRDSLGEHGTERVLHEYELAVGVDPESLRVTSMQATPRVLPWYECPWAAGSVQAIVGQDVRVLRELVSESMRGTSTCTHLNELTRTLADVGALVEGIG